MLFGCEQPFLWGERCVTFQKTAAKETSQTDILQNLKTVIYRVVEISNFHGVGRCHEEVIIY